MAQPEPPLPPNTDPDHLDTAPAWERLLERLALHGKEITFLTLGLVCTWGVFYCIFTASKIDNSVLKLVSIIFGFGVPVAMWRQHTRTRKG